MSAHHYLPYRVLGTSVRRVSGDMREAHGHPVLLAETMVFFMGLLLSGSRRRNWRWAVPLGTAAP